MLNLIDRFGGRVPLVVNAHPSLSGAQNEIGNSQILDVGKTGKSTYATAGVLHQQSHRCHAEQCIAWQRWSSACHGARHSIGKGANLTGGDGNACASQTSSRGARDDTGTRCRFGQLNND
jgi:hypothetical protein